MSWSADQLPDLSHVNAVVTGANSGLGYVVALELARHGARTVLACRRVPAGTQAADRIRATVPAARVEVRELDLASLESVRTFADQFDGPLQLLINNAGVMAPLRWTSTQDGYERQFGTNHLGHYALTGLLLGNLLAAEAARVVTVSSIAHRGGDAGVLFGNPVKGYSPRKAYSDSKLANLLFALELQRRAVGTSVTSTAAHPGVASSNLFASKEGLGANPVLRAVALTFGRLASQSSAAGARPILFAAGPAAPGSYTGSTWFDEIRGPVGPAVPSPTAQDAGLAAQLWDLSAELTEVHYSWPAKS